MNINVRKTYYPFIILLFLYAIYAAIFIYHTSFVVSGVRYFCLLDDAMISMTYARNLAAGHGLVWNAGEPPIEGITNLLWTLYMTLFHLLPIAMEKRACQREPMARRTGIGISWARVRSTDSRPVL